MGGEEIGKRKLKKIAGVKDLSSAIENLERKKVAMEEGFKNRMHHLFENLNPKNWIDCTLQNVKKSLLSKYSMFKEALAFGAGYLFIKKKTRQLKDPFINTFVGSHGRSNPDPKAGIYNPIKSGDDSALSDDKNENSYMNSQIEKVKAKPEVLPEPTYWPFFLAMGLAFLGWGLLTTWLISMTGFIIIIVSLTRWINILRHE